MTKAIFFDIDGTLVSFHTHKVSPAVVRALHRLHAQGIKLFISTGRHKSMLSYIRSVFPFDGCITLNGQYCFCGDQVLHRNPMSREAVQELVSAVQTRQFPCIFLEAQDCYINRVDQRTRSFVAQLDLPMPPLTDPARALEADLYQGVAFLSRAEEHLLLDHSPHLTVTRWHPDFLDVIPSSGGKDKGVDALLAHFGIPPEDSMAFGDGENDLSMLVHAGIGVAMGSASDVVKAQADYVTGTVDEDGIPSALEHFGLL